MLEQMQMTLVQLGITGQVLVMTGVGLGALLAILGVSGTFARRDPVLSRIAQQSVRRASKGVEAGLLRASDTDPKGLMKTLIPGDRNERSQVQRQLAEAGVTSPHGLRNYYLLRLGMGIVLPGLVIGLIAASRSGSIDLPMSLTKRFGALGQSEILMLLSGLIAVGFFGPVYWLRAKVNARRNAIEEAFPNILDLLQISVESGLGFDAAMIRVANESTNSAPEISQEFLIAQREIQAGRSREKALLDMAARTGVPHVNSFANVILQSLQYGSSVSDALTVYSNDMRLMRELRAQEMANKLPVKMSAVMASLMLPTLMMLALGPVVIRYIRYVAG